jgi:hypothetical protein
MPDTLIESERFGYERGSFTGARSGGRRGYFDEANKGTIFLDEIGDAPPDTVEASSRSGGWMFQESWRKPERRSGCPHHIGYEQGSADPDRASCVLRGSFLSSQYVCSPSPQPKGKTGRHSIADRLFPRRIYQTRE